MPPNNGNQGADSVEELLSKLSNSYVDVLSSCSGIAVNRLKQIADNDPGVTPLSAQEREDITECLGNIQIIQ